MKAIIHVNQHIIRANAKHGRDDPPITVRTSRGVERAHRVRIRGESETIYRPHKPLSCGAKLWIEARYEDLELIRDPDGISDHRGDNVPGAGADAA